jgi:hypothetical protein
MKAPSAVQGPLWYEVRPATAAELPAVFESWLGTYKRSISAGTIPNHLYNEVQLATITGLLGRGAKVAVLCSREAPAVVLAWVCYEADRRSVEPIVHYLFVKDGFRQRGYAGLLLKSIGAGDRVLYTHQTSFAKYWPRARFNPGIARRKTL